MLTEVYKTLCFFRRCFPVVLRSKFKGQGGKGPFLLNLAQAVSIFCVYRIGTTNDDNEDEVRGANLDCNQSPKVPHLVRMYQLLTFAIEIIANCCIICYNNHYYTNTFPYIHLHIHSWE